MGRGRECDPGASVPLELGSQPEATTSKQPPFLNGPEIFFELGHVRGSAEIHVLVEALPAQRPGRRGGSRPAAPQAPRSLRRGCGLQCAPLPDRDQHSSTSGAPQPAKSRSLPVTLPSPSRSPAKPVRPPSDSGNTENCNKKLTDSKQPWRRALACAPLPIWAAEATLAVGAHCRL